MGGAIGVEFVWGLLCYYCDVIPCTIQYFVYGLVSWKQFILWSQHCSYLCTLQKARQFIPIAVWIHVALWECLLSGCLLRVLVGAPVHR